MSRVIANAYRHTAASADGITLDSSGNVSFPANATSSGTVSDSKGNLRSIILNTQTSAYTLVAGDAGKAVYISTGGITIPASVLAACDAITIINNSGSDQTITQGSGLTLKNTADAATGNRTLAGRVMSTIYFASPTIAYISGAGLS